jgi:predicted aldo/keto reductase-like oxidoreductase
MQKRRFGKTNYDVTILSLGGCGLGVVSQSVADEAFKMALDSGINMIDVAPSYGHAEENLAKWVKEYRNQFFLAEKTMERTKEGAEKELLSSINKLGTDHFDLYQFHAVKSVNELDKIFSKGGAIEAFKEARDAGIIKYIGLTGHDDIRVHLKALNMFDFDTLLVPVNITSAVKPDKVNDYNKVLKEALERDVGITAIKSIQKQRWQGEQKYSTWYDPFDDQESITDLVHYTLSQEGVSTYSLPCETKLWEMVLNAGNNFEHLDKQMQDQLIQKYSKKSVVPLFPEM